MIITICASIYFSDSIIKVKEGLEKMGHIVNIPYTTRKILAGEMTTNEYTERVDKDGGDMNVRNTIPIDVVREHLDFIAASDAILVLNLTKKGIENYIGGSTLIEMGFAYGHGKKIFCYNPLPARGERMHYLDEIIDMSPVIIDGDLTKIG